VDAAAAADSAVAAASMVAPGDSTAVDSVAALEDSMVASRVAMAAGSRIAATVSVLAPESARAADMHADLRAVLWPAVGGSAAAIMVASGTEPAGGSGAVAGGPMALAAAGDGVRSAMSGCADS
jgi:hypothetical protein